MPLDDERDKEFRSAVERLSGIWKETRLSQVRVMVHRATYATKIADKSQVFSDWRLADAARMNARLNDWYDLLEASFAPNVVAFRPKQEHLVADPSHRWGLSTFHYIPEYYEDLRAAIRASL